MKLIFTRRYNLVDAVGITWVILSLSNGHVLGALVLILVGSLISVMGEEYLAKRGPETGST